MEIRWGKLWIFSIRFPLFLLTSTLQGRYNEVSQSHNIERNDAMYKRIFLCLLAAILCSSITACGGSESTETTPAGETTPAEVVETTPAETEPAYVYPALDLGGDTISILNMESYWGMHVRIDVDETTGEMLNDAMYDRSRLVEEKFNCKILDDRLPGSENQLENTTTAAKKEIQAGESTHDVMYIRDDRLVNFFTESLLQDLKTLPQLHLDEVWWDGAYNSIAQVGDSILGAAGDGHLMGYDSSWCVFFNEKIIENNGLELPYGLVKEGKWTLDKLQEYAAAVANVDVTQSDWTNGGNAVYGMVTHPHAPDKFIFSMGNDYVTKAADGTLAFSAETEQFYGTVEKLAKFISNTAVTLPGDSNDFSENKGYVYTFMNSYAAFLTAEVKTANNIRDMEDTFGILPFPKYDEAQEDYRTPLMYGLQVMTIPTTNGDAENTAAVMDAIAYEGSQTVVPVYFDNTVAHKGLRNENSVEMMEIMRYTRSADISVVYGWNSQLAGTIQGNVFKGTTEAASVLASHKGAIETKIEEFMELLGK